MTIRFQPKTEDEVAMEALLDDGTYDVVVVSAEEQTSKRGQDMIRLVMTAFDADGREHRIYDYISPHWMAHKWRHAFYSAGIGDRYESGEVDAKDFEGRAMKAIITRRKQEGYPPQNAVMDYVAEGVPASGPGRNPSVADNPPLPDDDDLPF